MNIQEEFEKAKLAAESLFVEISDHARFNKELFNKIMDFILRVNSEALDEKERMIISNWLWWVNYRIISYLYDHTNENDLFEFKELYDKDSIRDVLDYSAFNFSTGTSLYAKSMKLIPDES